MATSRRPTRRNVSSALVLAACCWATTAGAQARGAEEKAAAEALFDEAKEDLAAGRLEAACRKLEQSQSIDPGVGTLLYLGECYERSGRVASAWATFREAASAAAASGQQDRATTGNDRAQKLEPLLSRLTLTLAPNAHHDGLAINLDGKPVLPALWGTAFPVDPGMHTLTVTAPDRLPWSQDVDVPQEPGAVAIEVPELKPAPPKPPPPAEAGPQSTPPAMADAPPPDDGSTQRIIGLVTGAAGVVAVGVGAGLGIYALDKNQQATDTCSSATMCTSLDQARTIADDAQAAATAANILYVAGGAAILTGVILYFSAPDAPEERSASRLRVTPLVGPKGAAMTVGGTF